MASNADHAVHAITLRPAAADDGGFLFDTYASTRAEEVASFGWTRAQAASFLRMQFDARQRAYAKAYPSAETSIIVVAAVPAGAMIVSRSNAEIRLVDIALLPEFRSRGVGSRLLVGLIAEASRQGLPLRLSVTRNNRAARLYQRMGFVECGGDAMYREMELLRQQAADKQDDSRESHPHVGKAE